MAWATFQTNPIDLHRLLYECANGYIQLPDFQRSWVWDEDRIKSLIASVSCAFPVGALMSLDTGGAVDFKPRPIEGALPKARQERPRSLLLDGQQRMTSLYQVTLRGEVVKTINSKKKSVKRWFYFDIAKAIDDSVDREESVIAVPEDRIDFVGFGRAVSRDLSTSQGEYEALMFPLRHVFDFDAWQDGFDEYWSKDEDKRLQFRTFKRKVLDNFKMYRVPVIALDYSTSKEAVCVVFEKVNTGGKPLDAFELVTAMYAASGHELRKDWYGDEEGRGRYRRLKEKLSHVDSEGGILSGVGNTDFLQAISLFFTRDQRILAEKEGRELPPVSGGRKALLDLPLEAYKKYEEKVEGGFMEAAKFLHMLHIYRVFDLPYQSQIVPLAAILAELGNSWNLESNREKLTQWYWCGVFGELYGSAVETRIAKDFVEVPEWLKGGSEPSTVREAVFRSNRLQAMRVRVSAAYKGVNALLMKEGAEDFRSGQKFDHSVFFDENVDVHHVFPKDWCNKKGIKRDIADSILNKTPLSYRTNRMIGGVSPSEYLKKLEIKNNISIDKINKYLETHLIESKFLWNDDFYGFIKDREIKLIGLIKSAMKKDAEIDLVSEDDDSGDYVDESDFNLKAI